jgi:hypothetical protein
MKKIAEDNGQYRVNVIEKFVTENTFKDRVIATMMSFCPNCGKKS